MTLLDAVRIARRFWVTIAVCVLVGIGLAAAYAGSQPRLYTASSEAYVQIGGTGGSVSEVSVGNNVASAKAAAYAPLTRSGMVAERVIDRLGLQDSPSGLGGSISYETEADSPRIVVYATSTSPQRAKDIADAVVGATAEVASFVESGQEADAGDGGTVVRLVPVTSAVLPGAPVSPNVERLLAMGLVGGLVLAYLVVVARLQLDTRIRRPQDVTSLTDHGLMGTIPRSRDLRQRLHSHALLSGAVGESLRHLRTNLVFADPDQAPRSVVVTSPSPGEGKSTVSALLARSLALRGEKVVLVDGDLRRPMVATLFDITTGVGVTQVLSGSVPLREAIVATDTPDLYVLPAGRIPHNPSEVVGSERMRQLLDHLAKTHLVVVDAPPSLPVTDALILAQRVDGMLVVTLMGKTRKEQLSRTIDLADGVNARVLGVVLNGIPQGRSAGVYGYETYGYASAAEPDTRWSLRGRRPDASSASRSSVDVDTADARLDLDPAPPSKKRTPARSR